MNQTPIAKTMILLAAIALPCMGADISTQAAPPGFSTSLTGDKHDFDFLVGAWTTQQKRLKTIAVGSSDWIEAPANRHCATSYSAGQAIVEQSAFPNGNPAGLFIYTFGSTKQQWAIRWVNGKTGELESPSVGGFKGTRGEFYGDDEYNGRPIRIRVVWTHPDHDHARWEQAFSFDNKSWEINWISDFTRGDAAVLCPRT